MSLHDVKQTKPSAREREQIEWTAIMYGIAIMSLALTVQTVWATGVWSLDFAMSSGLLIAISFIAYRMGCPIFHLTRWFK